MINKQEFFSFIQAMTNRIIQGHLRYGPANRRQKYLTRLEGELKMYKKTGNMEHLINIANYCHLESYAPEHPKFHFDNLAKSATRID